MYEKEFCFTQRHQIFEPGDIVRPSHRSDLDPEKTYKVIRCIEPRWAGDIVHVIVEGYERFFNGEHLILETKTEQQKFEESA